MSLTYELDDSIVLDGVTQLCSAESIKDPTIFKQREYSNEFKQGRYITEAEFIYDAAASVVGHETLLFVKRIFSPKLNGGDGSCYNELRLVYHVQVTDSVSGDVTYLKHMQTHGWTTYGPGTLCPFADAQMYQTLASMFQKWNGTAWVWTANPFYKMSKGLVNIFEDPRTTTVT